MSFHSFLEKGLNSAQKEAVTHKDGGIMVIAGAGSGKTRVITSRIAYLISELGAQPTSIVALTFTNKAAQEMKARLISFLGHGAPLPFIGTFHSYCLLLLRLNPQLTPFSNFSILDADDQQALLKKIIKRYNVEKQISATQMTHHISTAKNKLLFESREEVFTQPMFKEIFLAYESEKAAAHSLDFDDLIIQVLNGFISNPIFTENFQKRIRHILVDEYQDTNFIQHELLKRMALKNGSGRATQASLAVDSICAVGDEDQSIYSWRGALVTNMLTFQDDFAPVKLIKVEQNYRSVVPILQAANAVISNNMQRHPKELWSDRKASKRIVMVSCQNGYDEAQAITSFLKCLPADKKRNDVAILYRTHFQSRAIEENLIQNGIPYYIVGGIRFYERKEIKDLLAYLRLIANPFDRTSFFRIINVPARGLGTQFEELVYDEWNTNPFFDFKQLLEHLISPTSGKVKGVKADGVKEFIALFSGLTSQDKTSLLIEKILKTTEYVSFLQTTLDGQEAETKRENIREFVQSITFFELRKKDSQEPANLESFLHEIALLQEKIEQTSGMQDHVQLMTLHAVKGLEFDTVIIAGLEEGLLPSSRSLHTMQALEEERRLFYVGITRAKERLLLTHAFQRNSYGQINDHAPSRFWAEVPESLTESIDATKLTQRQLSTVFHSWLGTIDQREKVVTFGSPTSNKRPSFQPSFTTTPARQPAAPGKALGAAKSDLSASVPKSSIEGRTSTWRKNQPVQHATFGMGVIKKVEQKSDTEWYLTVAFKQGEKKILSKFVNRV